MQTYLYTAEKPGIAFRKNERTGRFYFDSDIGRLWSNRIFGKAFRSLLVSIFRLCSWFDWHSSGLTRTVCGALKEGLKDIGPQYGIYICGVKGRTSRKTPVEIEKEPQLYLSTLQILSMLRGCRPKLIVVLFKIAINEIQSFEISFEVIILI